METRQFSIKVLAARPGSITLGLGGNVGREALAEIDRLLMGQKHKRILLDLSEVTLLDHRAARFLRDRLKKGVELLNCPTYIEHWIALQADHDAEV